MRLLTCNMGVSVFSCTLEFYYIGKSLEKLYFYEILVYPKPSVLNDWLCLKTIMSNYFLFFFIYMGKLQGHNPIKQSHNTLHNTLNIIIYTVYILFCRYHLGILHYSHTRNIFVKVETKCKKTANLTKKINYPK